VGDAVPEEGGEEDQAQHDGRAVQVELARRDGQLVAESLRLRWAVTVTFPAANSDMAKHGKAQFGTHKFYLHQDCSAPCSNLILPKKLKLSVGDRKQTKTRFSIHMVILHDNEIMLCICNGTEMGGAELMK
jgi:hypothetical protein